MKETCIDSGDARTKLLKAAAEIFATNGFKGATVREICKAANQALGAVNYHFRDKQGLYEAVFRATMEELIQNMSPIPENADALTP
ncbi:MAG: TetR family transcriptional regulator, partial [Candidatus Riflebacteria bacterium]